MGNKQIEPFDVAKMVVSTVAGVAVMVAVGCVLGPTVAAEEGAKKVVAGAGTVLIGMYASRQVKKMVRQDMDAYAMIAQKLAEKAQREAMMNQGQVNVQLA